MFSMDRIRPYIFSAAAIAACAVVAIIFFIRANPPETQAVIESTKPKFTYGKFITAPLGVPAGEMSAHRFNLNRKTGLSGKFSTENYGPRLELFIVTAAEFEKMKAGSEFEFITTTGNVPGGTVIRTFEPGDYYVVFDNRKGKEPILLQEAEFEIKE